jgi:thiamine-monophosphate kinase
MDKKNLNKTDISSLGEFGLIDRLTQNIKHVNPGTKTGVGDDAAVLSYPEKEVLVTTDLLLEGIHFNLVYTPLKHLGYKSVVVNLSDIYAMNGQPKQITVSLGISSRFHLEDIDTLYEGIHLACETYGVDLVGGDTSSSMTGLTISITALGEAKKEEIVYRNKAKKEDIICVSGNLGGAYLGLQLLERERKIFEEDNKMKPQLGGYEYIVGRQLKPEARKDIIEYLRENKILPTSMIDISDGLSSDIMHITKNSACGCKINSEKIPLVEETIKTAEEFNMDPLTAALNGGEDYELLFTINKSDFEKIQELKDIHIIGQITDAKTGNQLVTPDGNSITLRAQGWKHQ